jgi:hypothetical protein
MRGGARLDRSRASRIENGTRRREVPISGAKIVTCHGLVTVWSRCNLLISLTGHGGHGFLLFTESSSLR